MPVVDGMARSIVQHAYAMALGSAGRPIDALRAAAAAREGFRCAGAREGELDALIAIGSVIRMAGDLASALETFDEAEGLARELADDHRLAVVLRQIGICCSLLGRHRQALSSLREADLLHATRPFDREHLNTRLSLYNAHNRSSTSLPPGSEERHEGLVAHLSLWLRLAEDAARLGHTRTELMALGNHAITLHDCGRHREALQALAALMPRYRRHGMAPNEAICWFEMGRAHASLGEFDAARRHFAEAIERFDRGGQSNDLRDALEGQADVEEAMGNHREALAALRRVRAIEAETDKEAAHRSAAQRELRIELARLNNQWHRLASTDPLTGLANRRALDQWLREAQAGLEQGGSLVVLLHDMDHFKSINDGFGHDVGDAVLKRVAGLLQANCRPGDLAVRYGGEEFLLALIGVDPHGAVDIAERLRSSIERHDWPSIVPALRVTVSIGVAAAGETSDPASLLTLADRRLYAAKHGGRNRVIYAG